ncbi:hypothetical protein Tco_1363553 [Tanacetum coccineum]
MPAGVNFSGGGATVAGGGEGLAGEDEVERERVVCVLRKGLKSDKPFSTQDDDKLLHKISVSTLLNITKCLANVDNSNS